MCVCVYVNIFTVENVFLDETDVPNVLYSASHSKHLLQISIYQLCHIHSQHGTRDMTECIFIRLLFTIPDKMCCSGVCYLQFSLPHSGCGRVNNASRDVNTCLESPLSRLITNTLYPLSSPVLFLPFPIKIVPSFLLFVSFLSFSPRTQAFSHAVVISESLWVWSEMWQGEPQYEPSFWFIWILQKRGHWSKKQDLNFRTSYAFAKNHYRLLVTTKETTAVGAGKSQMSLLPFWIKLLTEIKLGLILIFLELFCRK